MASSLGFRSRRSTFAGRRFRPLAGRLAQPADWSGLRDTCNVTASSRELIVLIAMIAIVSFACGGKTASSGSASSSRVISISSPAAHGNGKLDPAVQMPAKFPSDFPVYPGARLTQASEVTANGQTTYGMVWETLDGVETVGGFYAEKLNKGDWMLTYNGSANAVFSAIFSRKSNQKDAGILGVELVNGVTHVTAALGVVS